MHSLLPLSSVLVLVHSFGFIKAECQRSDVEKCTGMIGLQGDTPYFAVRDFNAVCPPGPSKLDSAKQCIKELTQCKEADKAIKEEWIGTRDATDQICKLSQTDYEIYHKCVERTDVSHDIQDCKGDFARAKLAAHSDKCKSVNTKMSCIHNATIKCGPKEAKFFGTLFYKYELPVIRIAIQANCTLVDATGTYTAGTTEVKTKSAAPTTFLSVLVLTAALVGSVVFV